jgi:hypothetical protein
MAHFRVTTLTPWLWLVLHRESFLAMQYSFLLTINIESQIWNRIESQLHETSSAGFTFVKGNFCYPVEAWSTDDHWGLLILIQNGFDDHERLWLIVTDDDWQIFAIIGMPSSFEKHLKNIWKINIVFGFSIFLLGAVWNVSVFAWQVWFECSKRFWIAIVG